MGNFINEVLRRNLVRVAGAYAVVGWLLIQLAIALETALNLPGWFDTVLTVLVLICFPIAMLLAWALEVRPDMAGDVAAGGAVPAARPARVMDYVLAGGLGLICVLLVWQTLGGTRSDVVSAEDAEAEVMTAAGEAEADAEAMTAAGDTPLSIAVLPFEDFSPDKDQSYFANGIAEELLNTLSKVGGLRVISRASAFSLQAKSMPVSEIGATLGVGHVVGGSVRKAGSQLRITAQLIHTDTDAQLWSQTYDRPLSLENIFAIQDEIARAIVGELTSELQIGGETDRVRAQTIEAYELYLRALEQMHAREPETLAAAIVDFKAVLALDPTFAPAYAGLAETLLLSISYAGADRGQAMSEARPYIDQAVALAPNAADTLTAQSSLALYTGDTFGDYTDTVTYAQRAIAANPNLALAHHRLGKAYQRAGQLEAAILAFEMALALDPLSDVIALNLALLKNATGAREEAYALAERSLRLNPNSAIAYGTQAFLELHSGHYAKSYLNLVHSLELNPRDRSNRIPAGTIMLALGIDIPHYDRSGSPVEQAWLKLAYGEAQEVGDLLPAIDSPRDQLPIAYLAGDMDRAREAAGLFLPERLAENGMPATFQIYAWVAAAGAYVQTGYQDAEAVLERLETYFATYPIEETGMSIHFFDRAGVHALRSEDAKALADLQAYLDAGHVSPWLKIYPAFDRLRTRPEFQALIDKNSANAARHRAEIAELMAQKNIE